MMTGMMTARLTEPEAKTPWQRAKEKRDLSMWREYCGLLAKQPERSRTELAKYLKAKYGFASDSAYYQALKRGQQLEEGGAS